LFYLDNGYLSKLPLKDDDIKKLHKFRLYFFRFPYYLSNFLSFHRIKKRYFKLSYNEYKSNYRLFIIYIKKIIFFENFLKNKNLFLKFIVFKNLITINETRIFFWVKFLKKNIQNYNFKNILFKDFFLTILRLLAVFNRQKSIKYYFYLNDRKVLDLIVLKKKFYKKCRNYYVNEDNYWLDFFRANKEYFFYKNSRIYKNFWLDYSIDTYQLKMLLEKLAIKTQSKPNFDKFKKLNFFENLVVNIDKKSLKNFFKTFWPTRHESNILTKFVDLLWNKDSTIFFLRKSKIFNKGRYSRNRQIYRTGVYMCLWINVIFVYFYFFSFYRLAFNFGFMWIGLGLFIIAMTFGRAARYRLYNYFNVYNELKLFFNWAGYFFSSLYFDLSKKIKTMFFN
jgi:hypothetical protein